MVQDLREAYNVDYHVFPITTFLGSILCFMVLHCFHEVQSIERKKRKNSTHPPLWFRAVVIKEVESIMWAKFQQNRIGLSLADRERNLNYLNECLLDISNIHSLYGHWVSQLVGTDDDIVQRKIMKNLIDNLSKIQKSLSQKSCR